MYACRGCGKSVETGEACGMEFKCGSRIIYFYLCPDCYEKHNNKQLNLETLRFSFPLYARSTVMDILMANRTF